MLELRRLSKRFGAVHAVQEVSLEVPDGAFLVLLGPSGCGKSTLLRMLAGLEEPTTGQILFGGEVVADGDRGASVEPARRNAGLVFQSYALWPHMTVRGNIEWPLEVARLASPERARRVAEVLELLDIAELADRYPNEISGGQQQRVAIARTIAPRPRVLLLDEPLSNLDAKLRVEMRTELLRLHRASGATAVHVTHDQVEAMTMATHVAVMSEGRIEQFATPAQLLRSPRTSFVATFVGTPPGNLVPVTRDGTGYRLHTLRLAVEPPAERCFAMYRAETLVVSTEGYEHALRMELAEVTAIAGRSMVTAVDAGLRLTAIVEQAPEAGIGDPVYVTLPDEPECWFAESGERIT